jgi:DNA-binding MarR family transcriptional regulator
LRAHATVSRTLEAELITEQNISLAAYDVLVQLVEAEGYRLRMTELAEAVLLSRSGVTRLVDRLERDGLVVRERVAGDGRGITATMTAAGFERLKRASRTHLSGITAHFVEVLDPAALTAFGESCLRLAEAENGAEVDALPEQFVVAD